MDRKITYLRSIIAGIDAQLAADKGTTINLVDWGATGIAVLDDTNFGATTSISVTGIYQIQ